MRFQLSKNKHYGLYIFLPLPNKYCSPELFLSPCVHFLGDDTVIPETTFLRVVIVVVSHDLQPFSEVGHFQKNASPGSNVSRPQFFHIVIAKRNYTYF